MKKKQRHHKEIIIKPIAESESEFSFSLARIAVAQICQSMGFKSAQSPALEALTDIATRYLREIAKVAAAAANSAGRTQSNVADVIAALEDLESVQGFEGSSIVRSPKNLYTSAVIKDLVRFVKYKDEIPFAQPLPRRGNCNFQGWSKGNFLKCRGECGRWYCDGGGFRHVPRWLPAVPVVEAEESEMKKREVKWGCFDRKVERREENGVCLDAREERELNSGGIEGLGKKRGKVRFKMGIGIGNLRGVGIGKRVWCE